MQGVPLPVLWRFVTAVVPLLSLHPALLLAQFPGEIHGSVANATTGNPIAGAEVVVGDLAVTTGADGEFAVDGLAQGFHEIVVRAVGFAPYVSRVEVANGVVSKIAIQLSERLVELAPVTVAARLDKSAPTIDRSELVRRGRTLAQALHGWESVVIRDDGSGTAAPIIRASSPDEVMVLVDGVPINDPTTGVADLNRIAVDRVESVTLYTGAQTARVGGRAIAGALVIETRITSETHAEAWGGSHGLIGAAGLLSVGEVAHLRAETERLGAVYPVSLPINRGGGEALRRNADLQSIRATARARTGPLDFSALGEAESRGLPGTLSNPTLTARGTRLWLRGTTKWSRPGYAVAVISDLVRTTFRDATPPVGLAYDDSTWAATVAVEGSWRFLGGGVRADRFWGNAIRDGNFTVLRGYVSGEYSRTGQLGNLYWSLAPASRLDAWTTNGSPAISVRLDATAGAGPWSVGMGLGSSTAPPVVANLAYREGVGIRINPDLDPERVPFEAELSLNWRPETRGIRPSLRARGYAGQVKGLILWAPDFRFVWSPNNFDVNRAGVDLGGRLEIPFARSTLDATASFTNVTYDRPNGPQVIYRPRDNQSVQLTVNPGRTSIRVAWRRLGERYPNHGGVNELPPESIWDVSVATLMRVGRFPLDVAVTIRDAFDTRAEFIAGYPSRGRSIILRIRFGVTQ